MKIATRDSTRRLSDLGYAGDTCDRQGQKGYSFSIAAVEAGEVWHLLPKKLFQVASTLVIVI